MCVRLNERSEIRTLRILALVPKFLRFGNTRGEQTLTKEGTLTNSILNVSLGT